jgi:hypothetical protein
MVRNDFNPNEAQAEQKPRWRAPKLTLERVTQATGGDYVPQGNDGGDSSHATGFSS